MLSGRGPRGIARLAPHPDVVGSVTDWTFNRVTEAPPTANPSCWQHWAVQVLSTSPTDPSLDAIITQAALVAVGRSS